ncbi:YajQ family cyclic di-GMP-binding protein [Alteromonas oceanisediminis]|uniref:YajQ family cyclic di-GMP-binding protein n=1 Tax=Alteromonas oceanisediminis TaxID=2836180 RepID=UPI001BDAC7F3|nr:YajQ family cyclic di-GMP-binding protein [Alteromonas oceanisediminis]MBT0586711.1 YajQ family cyclic di-GMP-binding protein [Alteromonas oceanisediminis]
MPSFDIVSEIDMVDVKNATDNANRELDTRFDFRGVEASFKSTDEGVLMVAEAEFQLQQMDSMLRNACSKRGMDTACMEAKSADASGKTVRQLMSFKQGIDQPTAKKIVKLIKDAKLKVQASIQGEQVRVTGKKRDDLQEAMALVKSAGLGQPFQFTNFRD